MAVFYGEMQVKDDLQRMPAVVTIDKGTLRLATGRTELGEWPMSRVRLEEYTDTSFLLSADDEQLVLFLKEHERFKSEIGRFLAKPEERRRRPEHPAFRGKTEEGPSLTEELKSDVAREMSPIVGEIKHIVSLIPVGPPLWIGLGVLLLLIVFLPRVVTAIGFVGGMAALLVGGLGYADQKMALRIPDPLTPSFLVAVGAVLLILGMVVGLVR
jgi:hypothetical protein